MEIFKIELGVEKTDQVTGFTGTVTARCEYLSGCIQYCLNPRVNKDGEKQESHWFDEDRLIDIKKGEAPGGPQDSTPPPE